MLIMKDALYRVMDKDIIDGKCIIPQNIFRIKSSAFLNCKTLTEIDIPENVTIIEGSPFWECSSLKKVNILGAVTNIGELAFYGCSSLTEIGLPATVTSIGNGAFYGCSALTEISLPNGVTSIGDSIFSRCSGLKKINLPEGVTSIGDNVFLGCSSLTNISLPDGVTNIGDRRRIKKEVGTDISQSTIKKIKEIEAQSHKPQMQLMKDIGSIEGLSELLRVESKDLRIIHGEDWYYVYSNNDYGIYVFDLARGESRFEDEKMLGTREIGRGLDIIIAESIAENKPISAELREDTSYIEFLELMRSGYLEQIGDDVAVEFGAEYEEGQQISQEEQDSILERREEIRQKALKEEKTTMHFIKFRPTEKYKRVIEKRQARENEK